MKVISFLNSKGGVGKTTLCSNIARTFQFKNKILLIDSDPQRSLSNWHNAGDGLGMELISADSRASLLSSLRLGQQYGADLIMIDTPGTHTISGAALSISDLVIIPMQPSPLDVWATYDTVDLIRAAQNANPKLLAMIVINQAIPNCNITQNVISAVKEEMPGFYLASTIVHGRIAFARNVNEGKSVIESKDKQAIGEIEALTIEISGMLHAQNQS